MNKILYKGENGKHEEWRDVVGWEGIYQISSLGAVMSLEREVNLGINKQRTVAAKLLSVYDDKNGYPMVKPFKKQ